MVKDALFWQSDLEVNAGMNVAIDGIKMKKRSSYHILL
jgi:hypothetical protein